MIAPFHALIMRAKRLEILNRGTMDTLNFRIHPILRRGGLSP